MPWRTPILCACLTFAVAAGASAQADPAALSGSVAANLPAGGWISATDPVLLTIPRTSVPAGARLAVFIGRTDWTSLFSVTAEGLEYRPRTLTLPSGEQELVVYAVAPTNVWTEIAKFPLRVRTRGGFDKADTVSAVDIGLRSQMLEGHAPDDNAPARPTYRDTTVTTGFKTTLVRGSVRWEIDAGVVGVSYRQEALRFAQRGENAPRIDLASYTLKLSAGRTSALAGHMTFGQSRHLINGFASRGLSFTAPLGARGDISVMVANGTSVVGWSNPFGLDDAGHRMMAGTVGVELVRGRPGGLRLEAAMLTGSLRPVTGFTQQAITDAETSRGVSGRVVAADARNRARVDAGYTRSRFTNPLDPLLAQGTPIVPVQESAHNARYLDSAFDLVQNAGAGLKQTTITALFRHERVDPLFRSVGGSTQADRQQNTFEAQARVGEATLQATHMRMHDNLDEIPSILRSRTQRHAVSGGAPVSVLFGKPAASAVWAPRVAYTLDRVQQVGAGVPQNSEFTATHVPDQVSLNQTVTVDWERSRFRAGYRFGRSLQDNRNIGEERADLLNITNAITAGVSTGKGNLTADFGFDRAHNRELLTLDRTRRLTLVGDWRFTGGVGVTSNASFTWLGDDRRTSASHARDFTVEGFWEIAFRRTPKPKPSARLFVRYARQSGRIENLQFGVPPALRTGWTMNGGVNVSVF